MWKSFCHYVVCSKGISLGGKRLKVWICKIYVMFFVQIFKNCWIKNWIQRFFTSLCNSFNIIVKSSCNTSISSKVTWIPANINLFKVTCRDGRDTFSTVSSVDFQYEFFGWDCKRFLVCKTVLLNPLVPGVHKRVKQFCILGLETKES